MKEEQVRALFVLAGIPVVSLQKIENRYWPNHPDYDDMRENFPWWRVGTETGFVVVGWRKRVIEIDWTDTKVRSIVTGDNVTKDETHAHADSYAKAVEYLGRLRLEMARPPVKESPERATPQSTRGTVDPLVQLAWANGRDLLRSDSNI